MNPKTFAALCGLAYLGLLVLAACTSAPAPVAPISAYCKSDSLIVPEKNVQGRWTAKEIDQVTKHDLFFQKECP